MRKLLNMFLISSISLFLSFSAFADFRQEMKFQENKIISMNMIPTQFQFVALNISELTEEDRTTFLDTIEQFKNYNGNIMNYLNSSKIDLNKYKIKVNSKGQQMMTSSELKKYNERVKPLRVLAVKKENSLTFFVNYKYDDGDGGFDEDDFSDSLSLGQNNVILEGDFAVLVSYRKL